ncbi:MAG: hypothetical protein J6U81_06010, partial [Bacteroidales bacterium]|nr:hypothetical protein [Bacteroidales bacterium]
GGSNPPGTSKTSIIGVFFLCPQAKSHKPAIPQGHIDTKRATFAMKAALPYDNFKRYADYKALKV